jgi:hypothetical protein
VWAWRKSSEDKPYEGGMVRGAGKPGERPR